MLHLFRVILLDFGAEFSNALAAKVSYRMNCCATIRSMMPGRASHEVISRPPRYLALCTAFVSVSCVRVCVRGRSRAQDHPAAVHLRLLAPGCTPNASGRAPPTVWLPRAGGSTNKLSLSHTSQRPAAARANQPNVQARKVPYADHNVQEV